MRFTCFVRIFFFFFFFFFFLLFYILRIYFRTRNGFRIRIKGCSSAFFSLFFFFLHERSVPFFQLDEVSSFKVILTFNFFLNLPAFFPFLLFVISFFFPPFKTLIWRSTISDFSRNGTEERIRYPKHGRSIQQQNMFEYSSARYKIYQQQGTCWKLSKRFIHRYTTEYL